jgi:predicted metalloprotease with PDZ domain
MEKRIVAKNFIRFEISLEPIHAHLFRIRMIFQIDSDHPIFHLPDWSPGSYMIRDYSTHLFGLTAIQSGNKILAQEIGPGTYEIQHNGKETAVEYFVHAFDEFSVRTSYITENYAFLQPTSAFLYPENHLKNQVQITINANPFHRTYCSLTNEDDTFIANDYDELFDSPFFITNSESTEWKTPSSVPGYEYCKHELVVQGNISNDFKKRLTEDLEKITKYQIKRMGHQPNHYYLFIVIMTESGYGGLEHKSCSINIFDPAKVQEDSEYHRLLELLCHEYFHLWNGKRLRPKALGPFHYKKPNLTKELWVVEGVTSYYDGYFLMMGRYLSVNEFLDKIIGDWEATSQQTGEIFMSLEESSSTAWNKLYKRASHFHNTGYSYYAKGAVLIFCMDLWIRYHTQGKKEFLDIIKDLYKNYYLKKDKGYTKENFFQTASKITGLDLLQEFDHWLVERKPLDLAKYASLIGLELEETDHTIDFGFTIRESKPGVWEVQKVFLNKPAFQAGISPKDEILALNGHRMNGTTIERIKKELKPHRTIEVILSRGGKVFSLPLVLGAIPKQRLFLWNETNSSKEMLLARESFLNLNGSF